MARRIIWEKHYGEKPTRRIIVSCGNKVCVSIECMKLSKALPPKRMTAEERFIAGLGQQTAGGCIPWTRCRDRKGYGVIGVNGGRMGAHRYAWMRTHGPITDELHVLHVCDNPICVNVKHLHLGTHGDNMREMFTRGRRPVGPNHERARLSTEQVIAIRSDPRTHATIAREYNITQPHVTRIKGLKSRRWE